MYGVKLNERKKSEELRELSGLEPVSMMIKKSRLRWSPRGPFHRTVKRGRETQIGRKCIPFSHMHASRTHICDLTNSINPHTAEE